MPIRIRLLLLVLIGFFSIYMSVRYFLYHRMETSFLSLEERAAKESIERVNSAIDSEKQYLAAKIRDWAVWDDTYNFIWGNHADYMKENIPDIDVFLKNLNVDFFLIVDQAGKVHASGIRKAENDHAVEPVPIEIKNRILSNIKPSSNQETITGFLDSVRGPLIYSVSETKKSTGVGQGNGYFIIGSFAQQNFAKKLIQFTRENVMLSIPDRVEENEKFEVLSPIQTRISKVLVDLQAKPVLQMTIYKPRDVNSVFLKTAGDIEQGLIIVIIANFLLVLGFISWQVISPMTNFIKWQSELILNGNWKGMHYSMHYRPWKWLGSLNRDEFNELVQSTNKLLRKIDDSAIVIERQMASLVTSEKFRSLAEMSASIAHEINNPLAIVVANSNRAKKLLMQPAGPPTQTQDVLSILGKIETNCMRISKIISGLLSFSRNSAQDPFIRVQAIIPIQDALELFREKMKHKNIKLELDLDESLYISARSGQITQVIYNLLKNAMDEIQLQQNPWIRLCCFLKGEKVHIEVIDSGAGIPLAVIEKIMEPFFTTKEVGKGTGLGLSISLGIIQEHKGTLTINRDHPHTCFAIDLPQAEIQSLEIDQLNEKQKAS